MFLADFGGRDVVRKLNKNLSDLVEKGGKLNEGAKLINMSTGNTGKYIQGDLRSVNPFSQLKTSPKVKRAIIHNHPTNTSLSYSDLKPRDFISQTFAVTPDGSRFRGYVKDVEKYKSLKDNYPRIYHSLDTKLRDNIPNLSRTDSQFITSHEIMRRLHAKGVVHYRAKLSPQNRELYNKHKDLIEKIQVKK